MARRRNPNAPAPTENKLRGLRSSQYQELCTKLKTDAQLVCSTQESMPVLDYLDLIYTPEAKALWLRMAKELGDKWVLSPDSKDFPLVEAYVRASAHKNMNGLGTHRSVDDGCSSRALRYSFPKLASGWRHAYFTVLDDYAKLDNPMYNALPDDIMAHYAKYGRHMVRCCREWELFKLAYEKVKLLFDKAVCTREVQYYFSEVIGLIPHGLHEMDYLAKTRKNKFSAKFKPGNPTGTGPIPNREQDMWEMLGGEGTWAVYKKHIVGLCSRAQLKRSVRDTPEPSPGMGVVRAWHDPEQPTYKSPEEWMIRINFTPSLDKLD